MNPDDNYTLLLLILAACTLLILEIGWYVKILNKVARKLKEWREAEADGKNLQLLLELAMMEYRQHKHFHEAGPKALQQSQQVALNAITVGASLAQQVPSVYSVEYIKENICKEYDPERMKVAFLSISRYDKHPDDARNALLTVVYGRHPLGVDGVDDFFVNVYSNDGALQLSYLRSTNEILKKPYTVKSEWMAFMLTYDKLTNPPPGVPDR